MQWFRRRSQAEQSKPEERPERPWAVSACGRLLALQGLGFLVLAWWNAPQAAPPGLAELWLPGLYLLLGVLTLISSFNLLRLRPSGWTLAMLVQGAALLLALILYAREHSGLSYALMFFGVVLVVYLNYHEVRAVFPEKAALGAAPRKDNSV